VTLLDAMRQHYSNQGSSRSKLLQGARECSASVSSLINMCREGSKTLTTTLDVVAALNEGIADLEGLMLFAEAGQLTSLHTGKQVGRINELQGPLQKDVEGLRMLGARLGQSSSIPAAELTATISEAKVALDTFREHVKGVALLISSSDKGTQLQILGATKQCVENMQSLLRAATSACGRTEGQEISAQVLEQEQEKQVANLGRVSAILRGIFSESERTGRALAGAIEEIDRNVQDMKSEAPSLGTATIADILHMTSMLNHAAQGLFDTHADRDLLVAACHAVKSRIEDLTRAGKAISRDWPEGEQTALLDAIQSAIQVTIRMIDHAKGGYAADSPKVQEDVCQLEEALGLVVKAAGATEVTLDLTDPDVIAERNLLEMATNVCEKRDWLREGECLLVEVCKLDANLTLPTPAR
jgi:hypothetical protein